MPDEARAPRARILSLFGSRVLFGAERENVEVLSAWQRGGATILCLVRHESWNTSVPAELEARGFTVQRAPYLDGWTPGWRLKVLLRNPFSFVAGNWRFWRTVREFQPTHIHSFNAMYVLSFLPALSLIRTPLVYRAGDVPVEHRWIWRKVWQLVLRRTSRFLAVSNFIANALKSRGVDPARISMFHGIPPRRPGLSEVEGTLAPSHPRTLAPSFVFLGQLIPAKGVDVLLDAFRLVVDEHPAARLTIAGRITDDPVDAWARGLVDQVTRDPQLHDRVTFAGFVEHVPALLAGQLALVMPSQIDEALGLVVLEAKAAALAAIVTPKGALPELVRSNVDGIVTSDGSAPALAEAMKRYLTNPALAAQHGEAARASLASFVEDFDENCQAALQ